MPIIANGETLVAHHHPGETSFLLVTFIGAFHEGETEHVYLMKDIVESTGIACVGIATRLRNLYISDELDGIAAQVRAIRRPGQKLITLGQSSGGYAAIKFADLFGADHAVAFSPTFSMDEEDLGLTEDMKIERTFLHSALRFHKVPRDIIRTGMRPGPEDCAAPAMFIYDNHVQSDNWALDRFARLFPDARYIVARNFGHAVFERIDERGQWLTFLNHLANDDAGSAHGLMSRLTRNNEVAIAELLVRIARWRPAMVPVALRTERARAYLSDEVRRRHVFNTVLAYELAARGDVAGAAAHLRSLHPDLFPADTGESRLFLALSWHGEVLSYDNNRAQVVMSAGTLHAKGVVPALLDLRGDKPRLAIQLRAGDHTVIADEETAGESGEDFEVVTLERGLVAFRRGGAFMMGRPNDVPIFRSDAVNEWERFALLPLPEQPETRGTTGLNWFDESVMAARAGSAGAKPQITPAVDSARRKAAFRSFLRFFSS